jgi:HrpA-like RNA helicase
MASVVGSLVKIRDAVEQRASDGNEDRSDLNPPESKQGDGDVDVDGSGEESDDGEEDILPIDAHRNEIVNHVRAHRITVIHGETGMELETRYKLCVTRLTVFADASIIGCGKSSRLPVMLLKDAKARKEVMELF